MANFLPTSQLDFTTFRANLKAFLQQQDQFKDYDFEGSNLAVLLDLLAYNTNNNAFYLNMVGNEMFLDTALLRDSVVSHAKELNYLPRSYTSAVANITVSLTVNDPTVSSVAIPKGTKFIGTASDSTTYSFYTNDSYICYKNSSGLFTLPINVYEGYIVQEKFRVTGASDQRFVISNAKIDTNSLSLTVAGSGTDTNPTTYSYATSLYGLNPTSKVYFLQGAESGKYEIVFGDGVFGTSLTAGNIVTINYRICSGDAGNGSFNFAPSGNIGGYSASVIAVNSTASGGAVSESTNSIKFNAPRHFQTQERAVTVEDYKTLILNNFPNVKSVNVYGGEDRTDKPSYGLVYITPVSVDGKNVSDAVKQNIINYISNKSILSINPVILDPEYINLVVEYNVSYNTNLTTLSSASIASLITALIKSYSTQNLEAFNKNFRASVLGTQINEIDTVTNSIVSNEIVSLFLKKSFVPSLNSPNVVTLDFGTSKNINTRNPFYLGDDTASSALTHRRIVYSSYFTYNGNSTSYLQDDGKGSLVIISVNGGDKTIAATNIGTVDYDNGIVKINALTITGYDGTSIKIFAQPRYKDIFANKNAILTIDTNDITINPIPVNE